jgi:hypothetical protein
MIESLIVSGIVIFVAFGLFLAWALCVAAKRGDHDGF